MTATTPVQAALLCRFSIQGIPRTKKTSQRIVHIKPKKGSGGRGFTKVMPSEAYEEWLEAAVKQAAGLRFSLTRHEGLKLPLTGPLHIRMLIYRDRLSGDLNGFEQAVTDALQMPLLRARCGRCNESVTSFAATPACSKCGTPLHGWKQVRQGMGIIADDKQVQSKDGSRLLKDAARPRVEVDIYEFTEFEVQRGLDLVEARECRHRQFGDFRREIR